MKENRWQINTDISLSINLLGRLKCEKNWNGASHSHLFWEIVVSTFDFKHFEVQLFYPNETHKLKNNTEKEKHLLYIGFDFKYDKTADVKKMKNDILAELKKDSNNYIYALIFKKTYEDTIISSTLYPQIMVFLFNSIGKYMFDNSNDVPNTALITDIKKYINLNLDKKISIKQLARNFYITPKYLGQIFKSEVGEGILQYVKHKKVEKALLMLKSGEYNITQISQLLGFDNVQYFSTTFKSYYGFPPTYFQKANE